MELRPISSQNSIKETFDKAVEQMLKQLPIIRESMIRLWFRIPHIFDWFLEIPIFRMLDYYLNSEKTTEETKASVRMNVFLFRMLLLVIITYFLFKIFK